MADVLYLPTELFTPSTPILSEEAWVPPTVREFVPVSPPVFTDEIVPSNTPTGADESYLVATAAAPPLSLLPVGAWDTETQVPTAAFPADVGGEYILAFTVLVPPVVPNPTLLDPGDLPFRTGLDGGGEGIIFGGIGTEVISVDPGSYQADDLPIAQVAFPIDDAPIIRLISSPLDVSPIVSLWPRWENGDLPSAPTAPPTDDGINPVSLSRQTIPPVIPPVIESSERNSGIPVLIDPDADILAILRSPILLPPYRLPVWLGSLDGFQRFIFVTVPPVPTRLGIDLVPKLLDITGNQPTRLTFLADDGFIMATPVIFTSGETGPLTLFCQGADGTVEDLATATSVTLRVVSQNGNAVVNAVALTSLSSAGTGVWTRLPAEVATPGDYVSQVKVVRSDATVGYYPDGQVGSPITMLPAV